MKREDVLTRGPLAAAVFAASLVAGCSPPSNSATAGTEEVSAHLKDELQLRELNLDSSADPNSWTGTGLDQDGRRVTIKARRDGPQIAYVGGSERGSFNGSIAWSGAPSGTGRGLFDPKPVNNPR
jgi:hypothetical protein